MDVRCERCRAQYVFDDEQVTPSGLTVQCTNCGHLFRVKKKELVVTVAVRPDEVRGPPLPATAAAPRPGGHADHPAPPGETERREWRVRQADGNVFTFRELTTLQKWIVERKVARDDEISLEGAPWKRLGSISELASFFQVVEAAERARAQAAPPAVAPIPHASVTAVYGAGVLAPGLPPPPSGFPPPSFAVVPPPAAAAPVRPPAPRPLPSEDVAIDEDDLAAVRGRGRGRVLAALVMLAAVGGTAAYALWRFKRSDAPPSAVAVPITIEVQPRSAQPPSVPLPAAAMPATTSPAPDPAPGPAEAPSATGGKDPANTAPAAQPVAAVAPPEPVPEPVPAPPPEPPKPVLKPAAPPSPKALLAQAEHVRERGDAAHALDLYGRVIAAEPENAGALVGRGLCYLDLEQYAPAEASFRAALQTAPGHPDALMGLAETYRGRGRKAEALQYYEQYLALHPDGEEATVARNAIEELRR